MEFKIKKCNKCGALVEVIKDCTCDNCGIRCCEEKMEELICQSCGMPINSKEQLGINKDGSVNGDYCKYCYEKGEFIDKVSMEEYIEMCSKYGAQAGMSNIDMKKHCEKLFPTLKRWKENNK